MPKAYNVANIAKILRLSERRVRQLVDEEIIPKTAIVSNGWLLLLPTIQGYIKYLKDLAENANKTETQRLLKLKADKIEQELREKSGEVHSSRDVELFVSSMLVAFKSKLLALPHEVLPQLLDAHTAAGEHDGADFATRTVDILQNAIGIALAEMSTDNIKESR